MKKANSKPIFTVRRIANRNSRFPRIYRDTRQKMWRFAVTIFLAIAGVAGLFFFSGNLESENLDARIDSQFLEADFLGEGFKDVTKFSDTVIPTTLEGHDGEFTKTGVGIINSVFYNVKDYFKYIAGAVAGLYILLAATQIVTASSDEGIEKGKKNLKWSIVGLLSVFAIDVVVVAFFEGGEMGVPGESLFSVDATGKIIEEKTNLFEGIAGYFQKNARVIFSYIRTLAGAFAILFIFLAGAHMISAGGNEEKIEKEKKYLIHVATAFVTLLMLETMIFGFIYPENTEKINDPICVEFINYAKGEIKDGKHSVDLLEQDYDKKIIAKKYGITETKVEERIKKCPTAFALGASGSGQILMIVHFAEILVGGIAIFFIVFSGVSIISSMGNEEQVTKHKKTLLWGFAGLAVVMLAESVVLKFFFPADPQTGVVTQDVGQGLADLAGVTNFIATFVGVFSVISIIIAGMIWVGNFGNTEIAEKSKKIILGAVIGVILSISAYAIVNSITAGNPEGKGDGVSVEVNI